MLRVLKKLCVILNQMAPGVFYSPDDNAPRHAALALTPPTDLLSTHKTQTR